jgi:acetyl-CoA carboxylase biotin carboxyl carrier protein
MDLRAPTTGVIWQTPKVAGAQVRADEVVVIIESMKMEIPVVAPRAGRVTEILVEAGQLVEEDQVVARMEAET